MKRSTRPPRYDRPPSSRPSKGGGGGGGGNPLSSFNYATAALLAAVFVLGIGVGLSLSLSSSNNAVNVASREVIDRRAPNPDICQQFGASAIVSDMRVFITLNPFSVYVSQPKMTPGCVLRRNNWSILETRNLVNREQVKDCKNRMNTFGFTGTLDGGATNISCIYQNDAAGNLFLNPPGSAEINSPRESENF
ncbi:DUF3172 domain-containing protein [Spirulina sp. CS-785/01]|uniref:DUF3172 domain-containing protein n=1 Tax=Spirulina sp. CS-785/01 TaxID=3021716 RepID=UPI00232DCA56|nr:DUF3172 domain-containing protein [Spirulina sp. CS-785/01]MDB9314983.1 DUF3172 domain-containing protein [Spirulina sp. CS-785/01]